MSDFDLAAYRVEHARRRVLYLAACLDLATTERGDCTTEIEIISKQLAEGLYPAPTHEEWVSAYAISEVWQREYGDE